MSDKEKDFSYLFSTAVSGLAFLVSIAGLRALLQADGGWFDWTNHYGLAHEALFSGLQISLLLISAALLFMILAVSLLDIMRGLKSFTSGRLIASFCATLIAVVAIPVSLYAIGAPLWFAVSVFLAFAVVVGVILHDTFELAGKGWRRMRMAAVGLYILLDLKTGILSKAPVNASKSHYASKEWFSFLTTVKEALNWFSLVAALLFLVSHLVVSAILLQMSAGIVFTLLALEPSLISYQGALGGGIGTPSPWTGFVMAALALCGYCAVHASAWFWMSSNSHRLVIRLGTRARRAVVATAFTTTAIWALFAFQWAGQVWWLPSYFLFLVTLVLLLVLTNVICGWDVIVRLYMKVKTAIRTRRLWLESKNILAQFPQPTDPVGYVFYSTQNCTYTLVSLLLVLCRMKQKGWALIVMDNWPFYAERTGKKELDRFFALQLGYQKSLNFDWKVDWKNGVVEAAGINFYHPIWEALSRHFGCYTIDIPSGSEAEYIFREILKTADSTLHVAFRIANTVAGHGKPVRIVGASGQFVPNAVWNIFCREVGKERDMHFVWVQQGYQTYYADKRRLSTRITLDNMTRKWPYSNPYLPSKVDFEAWIAKGQDVAAISKRAQNWTKLNRATDHNEMSTDARRAYGRIVAHREAGKAVVCILGKMVFDLSTPWERGPAHSGMFDWLNHTVEVARTNPDVLYVIKPHPYEARPEIAGHVSQYFTDMIEQVVPQNVIVLAHDWFNLYTLFPLVDLGVLWNGTSGLELGLNNIPCVICSDWGPLDYPVGLLHPKDRDDYARIISTPKEQALDADVSVKCALLLEYTASDELMIPYDYAARPLTNEPFGPPYWYMDQVDNFIRNGDPNIDRACERFL